MPLAPGQTIDGKYRVLRLIGEGGMGTVYEGENSRIGRRVAIKVLHAQVAAMPEFVERFEREARAAARIGSPHVCDVLDLGDLPNGDRFIVMEYLDGQSFEDRLATRGKLTPAQLAPIAFELLDGLGTMHNARVIHRDLKPANVFLARLGNGRGETVKILDFGVAKLLPFEGEVGTMTQTGSMMGTPLYMSPEQARGARDVDGRTDLYAASVMFYRALTGVLPYTAESLNELLFKIVLEDPKPLRELAPDVDEGFAAIVHKGLARDLERRFATAREYQEAIASWGRSLGRSSLQFAVTLPSKPPERVPAPEPVVVPPSRLSGSAVDGTPTAWSEDGPQPDVDVGSGPASPGRVGAPARTQVSERDVVAAAARAKDASRREPASNAAGAAPGSDRASGRAASGSAHGSERGAAARASATGAAAGIERAEGDAGAEGGLAGGGLAGAGGGSAGAGGGSAGTENASEADDASAAGIASATTGTGSRAASDAALGIAAPPTPAHATTAPSADELARRAPSAAGADAPRRRSLLYVVAGGAAAVGALAIVLASRGAGNRVDGAAGSSPSSAQSAPGAAVEPSLPAQPSAKDSPPSAGGLGTPPGAALPEQSATAGADGGTSATAAVNGVPGAMAGATGAPGAGATPRHDPPTTASPGSARRDATGARSGSATTSTSTGAAGPAGGAHASTGTPASTATPSSAATAAAGTPGAQTSAPAPKTTASAARKFRTNID